VSAAPQDSPDVVVIGAGVIGLSIAWRAAQRGLRVLALDRGEPGGGTSRVAAGMLAPVAEATFGEQRLVEMKVRSAALWPVFAAELEAASGTSPGYLPVGTLYVGRDRDAAEALAREADFRRSLGLEIESLLPGEARRREPALAPSLRAALHLPTDHAVDPVALCAALAGAARDAGAELRSHTEVAELLVASGRVAGVRLAGGARIASPRVVVAAGAWAGELAGIPAEARVPVRPVKGQVLRLRDPAGPGLLTSVLRSEDVYVVPRGDGRYVLGASVEEKGFDTSISALATYELLRDAAEVLPGILELEIEAALAGLRPATPDNLPVIGPSAALEGLFNATGHYRNGVLLAPLTAEALAADLTSATNGVGHLSLQADPVEAR
jgi:glycine oxidase